MIIMTAFINPFVNKVSFNIEEYNRIYIISSEENIDINDIKNFTEEEFILFCKKLNIYKGHKQLLECNHHKFNIHLIELKYLNYIKSNFKFREKELVICIWGLKKEMINLYLEQYNPENNFSNYYNLKTINKYFNVDNGLVTFNLNKYLININEASFWEVYFNCKRNITVNFINRNFKSEIEKLDNEELKQNILNLENTDHDYLIFMKNDTNYIDISNSIKSNKYKVITYNKYSYDDIYNIIYNITNEKELYFLVNKLLLTKEYCHLIINNYKVMKLLNSESFFESKFNKKISFVKKYILPLKYTIGYTWLILYTEESIKKSMSDEDDRFIFDINTANLLPSFPYTYDNLKLNPYYTLLVDDEVLDLKNNYLTFGCVYKKISNTLIPYGISNLDEFKTKLNIFCFKNKNYFDKLEFNKLAVTGSCISACLPKFNPLELYHNNFIDFIKHYYNSSDLDIMCNCNDIFEFILEVYTFYEKLKNLMINEENYDNLFIIPVKNCSIYLGLAELEKISLNLDKPLEYIKDNLNKDNSLIKEVYKLYLENHVKKINMTDKKFTEEIYNSYYEPTDITNIKIYVSENDNNTFYDNLKFKIKKNNILQRDIEIFKIKYESFFSTVSKFHLPCVRAYYNNNNVFIMPSCITSMMTFINIDYKYFAGSNSPYDIIDKYRNRGFATLLNNTEKINYTEYIIRKRGFNRYDISNINFHLGYKNINNFKFYGYNNNLKITNYNNFSFSNFGYIVDYYDNIYNNKEMVNYILNENHINSKGYINPLKKWVLEMLFDKIINI